MPQLIKSQQEQANVELDPISKILQFIQSDEARNWKGTANRSSITAKEQSPVAMEVKDETQEINKAIQQQVIGFGNVINAAMAKHGVEAIAQGVPASQVMNQYINDIAQIDFNKLTRGATASPSNGMAQPLGQRSPMAQEIPADKLTMLDTLMKISSQGQQKQIMPQEQQRIAQEPTQQRTPLTLEERSEGKNFLGRFREGFAEGLLRSAGINTLEDALKAQEIRGEKPLQKGEREKLELEQGVQLAVAKAQRFASEYQKVVEQENKISEQYVKDFEPLKQATDSVSKITELYNDTLKSPNSNVNDFFLVYNAIKAADPTAVKEGEYKTVQGLLPIASKILNVGNFALKGETLTPEQRKLLVRAATTQYNGLAKRFAPLAKQYEDKIKAYGGVPERALINYGVQGSNKISELEAEMKKRGLLK